MTLRDHIGKGAVVLALTLASGLGLAACDSSSDTGTRTAGTNPVTNTATPAAADEAAIVHMREEEKLARDVYTALGEQWGTQIFTNIAASEQRHMDQVATLLGTYGIEDPAAGNGPGEFTDPDLQALYDRLVAQGSTSLTDALGVGKAIEELDIADLKASATSAEDVQAVWDRLEAGSNNHLRAFESQLDAQSA